MDLIFLSLGWLAGLWLGQTAGSGVDPPSLLGQATIWLACLVALSLVAVALGWRERRLRTVALAVALGLLGIWRAFSVAAPAGPPPLSDGQVVLLGTIAGRPEPRDASLLLILDVEEQLRPPGEPPFRYRVLVRTDRYQDWGYGDRVVAQGELRAVDPGSGYWAGYLARQGIYSEMSYPQLRMAERQPGMDLGRAIDDLRTILEGVSARLLPEPQASLLAGILVGARASMPADFRSALNLTGTSHIVAVSGFNVTVVAGIVLAAALRFLSRRRAILLALLAVWGYAILTGLPPSAVRAALMATMTLLAGLVGRGGDALSFLCFSAAIMAGLDPMLLYDLGFQLSFLATAGLVLLEPVLRGWMGWLPGFLSSSLSVTLAAQLATLPVLVTSFHTLSLVSPLTNLAIAPVLPALMGFGALTAGLGSVEENLGQIAAPLAWLYLTYMVEIIRWTGQLSWASVATGDLGPSMVILYYAFLLALAFWQLPEMRRFREAVQDRAHRMPLWALAGAAAAIACVIALMFFDRPDGRVHVYFLEVGGGEATFIRGPGGQNLLVDGGASPTAMTGALGRRLGFLDRGLDATVITGFDERHLGGLLEVGRRHSMGLVWQPAAPKTGRPARAWQEMVKSQQTPVVEAAVGQRLELGERVYLEVLWASPEPSEVEGSAQALLLTAYGTRVLLIGELARSSQAELARISPGRVDILRVPRQGATDALDEQLLQTIFPRVAVLSVQPGNRQGYPSDSTLDQLRGSSLFRTDSSGTIEIDIGPDGYQLFTGR